MGTEFHIQYAGILVYIHSLMHSFHLQVFLKHPLYARHCAATTEETMVRQTDMIPTLVELSFL